jgi:hypothetical protein
MTKLNKILIFTVIAVLSLNSAVAQEELTDYDLSKMNNYKYVSIPLRFGFQQEDNEYLLSSLTKHLFDLENYTTFVKGLKVPDDYAMNNCLGLTANLESKPPGMFSFTTEVKLKITNCKNEVLFSSTGSSGEKDYKESYHDAVRKAFAPLREFDYKYNDNKQTLSSSGEPSDTATKEGSTSMSNGKDLAKTKMEMAVSTKFSLENKVYSLKKIEAGYILKNTETDKRFGFINKTSDGDYLFNSEKVNGNASIDQNGNLIVEYFDRSGGQMTKMTFKKTDQ